MRLLPWTEGFRLGCLSDVIGLATAPILVRAVGVHLFEISRGKMAVLIPSAWIEPIRRAVTIKPEQGPAQVVHQSVEGLWQVPMRPLIGIHIRAKAIDGLVPPITLQTHRDGHGRVRVTTPNRR